MATPEVIVTPIPPNQDFLPLALPTNPTTRFVKEDVILEPAKESDLPSIAAGLHKAFPETFWWITFEPHASRPSDDVRVARYVARLRPVISHAEDFTLLVARLKETGEVAGCAGWHHPSTGTNENETGSGKNMWLCDLPIVANEEKPSVVWESGYPWKSGEREEAWEGINSTTLAASWEFFENIRREEMKGEPHWYLAPFYVEEKFRGRGVGRMLLQWAIDQADGNGAGEPMLMYLEALPNARPVYLHVGFRGVQGKNRELIMTRRGIPKGGLTAVDLGEAREL